MPLRESCGIKKILMRRSRLPLKKLYDLTKYMLGKIDLKQQVKKKGRPKKYEEPLIIVLWLFQNT